MSLTNSVVQDHKMMQDSLLSNDTKIFMQFHFAIYAKNVDFAIRKYIVYYF